MARGNEEYLKGRKAGVTGTSGQKRKGVAEKTVHSKEDTHDSGGEAELPGVARSLYQDAVKNRGDRLGDKALTER